MSKVVTPPQMQPSTSSTARVPQEKIAMRAYEKWCKRGRPQGTDKQDWIEAESELRAELARTQGQGQGLGALPTAGRREPPLYRQFHFQAPAGNGGGFVLLAQQASPYAPSPRGGRERRSICVMTLAFDHLAGLDSPLRRLDPRWKLAALVPAAGAVAVLRTLPAALLALAGAGVLVALGRLPLRWYLGRLGGLSLFLLLFVVLLPFLLEGPGPAWDLGPVHFSLYGLIVALVLCCKALAIVSLMLVVLATAPLDATLKAAHALHVPGLIVQLLMLTYRYTFLLAEELGRLRIALRVRGYRNRANLHSYRTVGHVAGTLLVRSHERAERVGQAMRCRGFDGRFRSLVSFRTRWPDVAVFLVIIAVAVGLLAWDLAR